jgi:hypothetical protein
VVWRRGSSIGGDAPGYGDMDSVCLSIVSGCYTYSSKTVSNASDDRPSTRLRGLMSALLSTSEHSCDIVHNHLLIISLFLSLRHQNRTHLQYDTPSSIPIDGFGLEEHQPSPLSLLYILDAKPSHGRKRRHINISLTNAHLPPNNKKKISTV